MTVSKSPPSRLQVTLLEDFLRSPPAGFSVEKVGGSALLVSSDPDSSLVLIDDIETCGERVIFQKSLGSKVKMNNLWEYSSTRKSLLSKRIYLVASACLEDCTETDCGAGVPQRYVVSVDGSDPFIRCQMERGLDWTISSVAGESYRVDIDLAELLESCVICSPPVKVSPAWTNASFTLKYSSDALFDFAHWFGFSKRLFKLRKTWMAVG
ncbi:mesenteric estrogen-dependent adipogenesis protein [Nelusetta ayraudi]|uniref:mesenteric estrogen-dependent adipogenesis protein n=1 Tax=Nelusetta ayraudi TaxID=303726 RepID=UPI003F6ED108